MFLETQIDIVIGVNNYIQIRSTQAASFYRNSLVISQIPTSMTIINNVVENNYLNPPVSQLTWLSLKSKGVVTAFIQATFPQPWRSCFTTGNFDVQQEGSISHVFAPNLSSVSYISISKTAKYRVDLNYNHYISFIGGVNNVFYVYLYNITDGVELG